MGKMAFIFPGQGSQYVGMAQEFYEQLPSCRKVFELASEASGLDVPALCFEENEKINITEYTQICMLTAEAAILKAIAGRGDRAGCDGRLKSGRIRRASYSGRARLEDAFALVRKRGIYMQEAVPTGGAMAAVLGLAETAIEKACEETEGIVSIANYNCPGQIVITGEEAAVTAAGEKCKEAGAKRVVPLKVSGSFHSPMLTGAGEKLGEELAHVEIHDIAIPYITNVTADYVKSTAEVKDLLKQQVSSSVRWQQSVQRMLDDGVDTFVEIGPGKTLSGFMKKISREAGIEADALCVNNIDKMEDFEKFMQERR